VGKSQLAIRFAHEVVGRYPGGQLYVDLKGATAGLAPLDPRTALGGFLRALGERDTETCTLAEATERFQALAATRRLLVVLDNARDAAQVAPLLPGHAGCLTLVTSRRTPAELDGVAPVNLGVLPAPDAVSLLGRLAGVERVLADPDGADRVARLCGHLPLALRIAGARLAAHPRWSFDTLANRLQTAQVPLDELQAGDLAVRASFRVSHELLEASSDPVDRAAAAAFSFLGLPDGADLGVPAAAQLLDRPEPETERLLERLADGRLLDRVPGGRYRLHDLMRLLAREQIAVRQSTDERDQALTRLFRWYAASAWHTHRLLRPGDPRADGSERWGIGRPFADVDDALAWLETERTNLVAAATQAARTPAGTPDLPSQLAQAMFGFCFLRGYRHDWIMVNEIALAHARATGDRAAAAHACRDLGVVHQVAGRYETALGYLDESMAMFAELGDRAGQANCLTSIGWILDRQGHPDEAADQLIEGLRIRRELGDRHGLAVSLTNLGLVEDRLGRSDEAITHLREGMQLFRRLGSRRGQAVSLGNLGKVYERLGRFDRALALQQRGLAIFRELADRYGELDTLLSLGMLYRDRRQHERALSSQQEALAIGQRLNDAQAEAECLLELATTLDGIGQHEQASAYRRRAGAATAAAS